MKWFLVSPFSINVLSVALLLFFMIYFLIKTQSKSPASLSLIIFLSGATIVFISFFVIFASLDASVATVAWWLLHSFVFGSVAMVQFAYWFPINLHPKQSRKALIICSIAAVLIYPYYILRTLNLTPQYSFDGYLFFYLNTPEIGIVIGLQILWVIFIFFRKTIALSGYEPEDNAGLWRKFFKPRDRSARAIRNLLIIFFTPIVLVIAIIMAYQGHLSWELVAHILGSGFMVVVFIFTVVYINISSEPSTIMIKLVGISLGTVLIVFGVAANFAVSIKALAYDQQHRTDANKYIQAVHMQKQVTLPDQAEYLIAHNRQSRNTSLIAAHDSDLVVSTDTAISAAPSLARSYRRFNDLDANRFYISYQLTLDDIHYEIGYSYLKYRAYIHATCLPLALIVICTALFVVTVFPVFFQRSLVNPMDQLLSGVRKVNEGNLDIEVPVLVEDEIGYLSKSFNNMVVSINSAQTQLKDSLDFQVKLTDAYSCFVPREFLTFLDKKDITDIRLGDNIQKEMTILFSDIRSFTTLSEKMSPQENFNFINSYLSQVGPVVREHRGFIDKYVGDAVMALFPHSAEDALQSALSMLTTIRHYNSNRHKQGYPSIRIGIGIHTGSMMLGTIGEEKRMEGTVISDAVNLASRMERLTKVYGSWIIISRQTLDTLQQPNIYKTRFLDYVQVMGKVRQVEILEIIDPDMSKSEAKKISTRNDFSRATTLYQQKEFKKAHEIFSSIVSINPDDIAAALYKRRCKNYEKYGTPDNWDGVTVLKAKDGGDLVMV